MPILADDLVWHNHDQGQTPDSYAKKTTVESGITILTPHYRMTFNA